MIKKYLAPLSNFISHTILVTVIGVTSSSMVLAQGLPDFTQLVEDNADAIVNIGIRTLAPERDSPNEQDFEELLRYFYREGGPQSEQDMEELRRYFDDRSPSSRGFQPRERASLGSGFIISEDGYIVTNHHVVDGADEITVTLNDQREYSAELIGSDVSSDLAVLKIDEEGLSSVILGNSNDLKVGEWVLAIGSPFGLSYSVSAGIISYMGRSLPSEGLENPNYVSYIQTDVAINPGHSGGPLFNLQGEVIGINSQIFSSTGGSIGLSFAIPVDVAKNVVGQIRESGEVRRGWMGVAITDVSQELAEAFNLDTPRGALVNQVIAGSPAETAGFKSGDVIVTFNNEDIRTSADVPYQVGLTAPGSTAIVEIIRDGSMQTVNMTVGDLGKERGEQLSRVESPVENSLGLVVSEISEEMRQERSLDGGVVVENVTGDVAQEAGIQAGDILLSINNQALNSIDDFDSLVSELPSERVLPVLVSRGGRQSFFTIKIPQLDD